MEHRSSKGFSKLKKTNKTNKKPRFSRQQHKIHEEDRKTAGHGQQSPQGEGHPLKFISSQLLFTGSDEVFIVCWMTSNVTPSCLWIDRMFESWDVDTSVVVHTSPGYHVTVTGKPGVWRTDPLRLVVTREQDAITVYKSLSVRWTRGKQTTPVTRRAVYTRQSFVIQLQTSVDRRSVIHVINDDPAGHVANTCRLLTDGDPCHQLEKPEFTLSVVYTCLAATRCVYTTNNKINGEWASRSLWLLLPLQDRQQQPRASAHWHRVMAVSFTQFYPQNIISVH